MKIGRVAFCNAPEKFTETTDVPADFCLAEHERGSKTAPFTRSLPGVCCFLHGWFFLQQLPKMFYRTL